MFALVRRSHLGLVGALAAVLLAVPATAGTGSATSVRLQVQLRPTSTGAIGLQVDVVIGEHADKPARLTNAVISLPRGTRIHTERLPRCTATNAELQVAGRLACPPNTYVGSGTVTAVTGVGSPVDPLVGDDTVINAPAALVEVVTPPGAPAPAAGVDRLTISGRTLTAHPPQTPGGPPDASTNIRAIHFTVNGHGKGRHAYITTPSGCPTSGVWTVRGRFTFADGTVTRVRTTTPCL